MVTTLRETWCSLSSEWAGRHAPITVGADLAALDRAERRQVVAYKTCARWRAKFVPSLMR